MPCLNEAATVGGCVAPRLARLPESGAGQRHGEVLVADHGSSERLARLAEGAAGARVGK
jgi:hypothetical protein